jgi:O-antigen/teichoic acid export membrane protein
VTKNTVAQIVGYAAQVGSQFFFLAIIGHLAGAENLGDFSFVVTYTMVFTFLPDLGLGWLLTREVARRRDQVGRYIGNAFTVSLVMGTVSLVAMGLLIHLLGYPERLVQAVYLGSLALVLEVFSGILWSAFRAYERMELEMYSLVAQEGLLLLAGTVLLFLHAPFTWVFVAYLGARVVGLALAWVLYRRTIGPVQWRFEWPFCRQQLVLALPFALNLLLSVVYVRIDVLMLSFWHGSTAVGYYEAATNLALRLNVLARVLVTAVAPIMARAYLTSVEEVRRYARATVRYLALLSLPLTVGTVMLAGPIIGLLYGLDEFAPSVLALQILGSMTVLRFLDTTLSVTLTSIDRQGWRTACVAIAAAVNVLLNLALLPRYGFLAASITTVFTEVAFFLSQTVFLGRRMPAVIRWEDIARPALASLVMAVPLWFLRDQPLWATVPMGVAVYVGALFALQTFSLRERQLMQHVLGTVAALPARWWRR